MTRFWVSWFGCWETLGKFTLYTPWWESGYTFEETERQCICAAIKARDEDHVREIVIGSYDDPPGVFEFRFVEPRPDDWSPYTERFPEAEWMAPYWDREAYEQAEAA